jgi:hypothetical protein
MFHTGFSEDGSEAFPRRVVNPCRFSYDRRWRTRTHNNTARPREREKSVFGSGVVEIESVSKVVEAYVKYPGK